MSKRQWIRRLPHSGRSFLFQVLPYLHEALEVDDKCSQKSVCDRQVKEVYELRADRCHEQEEHEVLDVLQDDDVWLIRRDFS